MPFDHPRDCIHCRRVADLLRLHDRGRSVYGQDGPGGQVPEAAEAETVLLRDRWPTDSHVLRRPARGRGGGESQARLYFCATFAWFLGQMSHLDIYFLSTPRQMPQTITNIPRCLPQILTLPKFWYHLAHSFSRKNVPFDFERSSWEGLKAPPQSQKGHFSEKMNVLIDTKTLELSKSADGNGWKVWIKTKFPNVNAGFKTTL